MCGILAAYGQNTEVNIETIRRIIEECQIRGKHATGVVFLSAAGSLRAIVEPKPAKEFLRMHWKTISDELRRSPYIRCIAHTRYSTSGIEHNQPIFDEQTAIALNGVITQAHPSKWPAMFGASFKTTNDAEIVHMKASKGEHPLSLSDGIHASMAVVTLKADGSISCFRNGMRPMWRAETEDMHFWTSTKDIFVRAGITQYAQVRVGEEWIVNTAGDVTTRDISHTFKSLGDWQNA